MSGLLLQPIDVRLLASRATEIREELPLDALPRVAPLLSPATEESARLAAEVSLAVQDGVVLLRGRIRTRLAMECQRCLEPVWLDIDKAFALALLDSVSLQDRVAEGFEAVSLEELAYEQRGGARGERDRRIVLAGVLEDELLLQLPMSPAHEDEEDCGPLADVLQSGARGEQTAGSEAGSGRSVQSGEDESPFAVLASLKGSARQDGGEN